MAVAFALSVMCTATGGVSGSDFANELGKQKIKLSLNQKEEWQDWHTGKGQA